MPGAHQVAGKDALELKTVEAARVRAVVAHRATHEGLRQKQQCHDDEEFDERVLPWTGAPGQQLGLDVVATGDPAQIIELAKGQQHGGYSREKNQQAEGAPQHRARNGQVADARVVGEVVGVGVRFARPRRNGSPGRPGHEGRELAQLCPVGDEIGLQATVLRRVVKVAGPVCNLLVESGRLCGGELQHPRGRVVAVRLQRHGRFRLHRRRLARVQRLDWLVIVLLRDGFGRNPPHAVQGGCREVGPEIGAVTPDAAVVHQAVAQKHRLAFADIVCAEHQRALRIHHPRRDGRGVAIRQRRD